MRKDLKDIIQRFNDIQYPNNEGKRIVIATLKPDYTIVWKDGTKTYRNKNGTV